MFDQMQRLAVCAQRYYHAAAYCQLFEQLMRYMAGCSCDNDAVKWCKIGQAYCAVCMLELDIGKPELAQMIAGLEYQRADALQ